MPVCHLARLVEPVLQRETYAAFFLPLTRASPPNRVVDEHTAQIETKGLGQRSR